MNRRDFLKGLPAVVAAGMGLTGFTGDELLYALVSTPDAGTTLNDRLAGRARTVAERVITTNRKAGLLTYERSTDRSNSQIVEVAFITGDKHYTVEVTNSDNSDPYDPDNISIWVRPKGTVGTKYLTTFSDTGLDGKCDFGVIPPSQSKTGRQLTYDARREVIEGVFTEGRGLENRNRFQGLYEEALTDLINFYD